MGTIPHADAKLAPDASRTQLDYIPAKSVALYSTSSPRLDLETARVTFAAEAIAS